VNQNIHALRLNVGFLIHQSVGISREFLFEYQTLHIQPDLDVTDLSGYVRITRTPQGLLVQVKLRANLQSECVRCLTEFNQPLETDFTELYAFTQRSVTESGLILPEDGHIDLAPLVRDYMLIEIPIQAVCSNECKGLCPVCGENLNDNPHVHEGDVIDPRLEGLKKLLETD
jgi:uncharacterized protein